MPYLISLGLEDRLLLQSCFFFTWYLARLLLWLFYVDTRRLSVAAHYILWLFCLQIFGWLISELFILLSFVFTRKAFEIFVLSVVCPLLTALELLPVFFCSLDRCHHLHSLFFCLILLSTFRLFFSHIIYYYLHSIGLVFVCACWNCGSTKTATTHSYSSRHFLFCCLNLTRIFLFLAFLCRFEQILRP
jgi:hypothetical protein